MSSSFLYQQYLLYIDYLMGDGRQVAAQLLFSGLLLPGFVQNSTPDSCIVPIQLFVSVQEMQSYSSTDTDTSSKCRKYFTSVKIVFFPLIQFVPDNLCLNLHLWRRAKLKRKNKSSLIPISSIQLLFQSIYLSIYFWTLFTHFRICRV